MLRFRTYSSYLIDGLVRAGLFCHEHEHGRRMRAFARFKFRMSIPETVLQQIRQIIPPLDGSLHKGQSGM